MKHFLITLCIQLVLWFLATVICGMMGVQITFLGGLWVAILVINVIFGTVINFLIGNY
jgi:hypothetical protein